MAAPSVTNTFSNSTTADATQVNTNFTDLINGASDGTKDYSINALTCAGAATLNGNVTLGNATADDITITGSLASTINIKTTNTYNIGSATLGLLSVYFGSSSGAFSTRVIGGAAAASWTLTLPTAVPTGASFVLESTTGGATSWTSRTKLAITAKTTTYTADPADDVITCSTSGGAWTLTLPAAASNTGKTFYIKKTSSDVTALTIDGNASETIDGATTTTLNTQYEAILIQCDGSNWHVLERTIPGPWTSFTPTGGWTTNTTYAGFWRRTGDSMELFVYITLAGAPNSATLTINPPLSLSPDTAKMTTNTAVGEIKYLDSGTNIGTGVVVYSGANFEAYHHGAGSAWNATVPITWAVNDHIALHWTIPITGWKG